MENKDTQFNSAQSENEMHSSVEADFPIASDKISEALASPLSPLTTDTPLQSNNSAEDSSAGGFKLAAAGAYTEGAVIAIDADEETLSDQVKVLSPLQMVLKRFFRSKLSVIGLATIVFLFAFAFLGPFLYHIPGIPIYGETQIFPSYGVEVLTIRRYYTDYFGNRSYFYYVTIRYRTMARLYQPRRENLLGTDTYAFDVLTRLMYGGRISLGLAFLVVFISTFLGVIMGALAGFFGKWVDQIIMRIVDLFMCIPSLPILLILGAMIDANEVPTGLRIWILMGLLTLFGWSGIARLVRGQILLLKEQDYMLAAESMGLSAPRRIFRHLVPNVMPQLIVSMTLSLGGVILSEASLSFLGFGIQSPYAAWGTMIGTLQDFNILINHFHLWGPPGVLIMMAVLGFNFIGDGLRDAFDPRMKR